MSTLTELSISCNADKNVHGHNYIGMYEFWLKDRKVDSLLEVGFGPGGSPRMWRAYYPNAKIYIIELFGKEFAETWKTPDTNIEGVDIIAGDASKPETWANVPENIDVIIDDGSHKPSEQIDTFMIAFKKLRSHGLYFIEDIYYNFIQNPPSALLMPWLNSLMENQQNPSEEAHVLESRDFYYNRRFMSYPASDIFSYHIYKNVLMFEKA